MLRRTLLALSKNHWMRQWMERSPLSRPLTSRFVAGQTLEEGIGVLRMLAGQRISATLDFLGENVQSLSEAARSRDSYLLALDQIQANRLPATVSLKLTQFGLDFSEEACRENVAALAAAAQSMDSRVEIDMESSEYTGRTLQLVSGIQRQFPGHVRAVIQAYLYRSEDDIRDLNRQAIPVRLCKGAYRELPSVAFARKTEVDANYVKLMRLLLDEGTYPAIASHDSAIVREALRYVAEKAIAPERFEFQMLYGIRRDLQDEIVQGGYRLRLYVPYGEAWYPYFMRRLAERPANVLFLAKNLVRR
jgi:proline dehydrogenase